MARAPLSCSARRESVAVCSLKGKTAASTRLEGLAAVKSCPTWLTPSQSLELEALPRHDAKRETRLCR